MMLAFLQYHLLSIREVVALEVTLLPNEVSLLSGVHVKRIKGKLVIQKEWDKILLSKEIANYFPPSIPLCLVVNGRGVLIRKNNSSGSPTSLADHLSGSNPDEFVHFHYQAKNEEYYFLTRKEILRKKILFFSELGLTPLSVAIGIQGIETLLPLVDDISISNFAFHYQIKNQAVEGLEAQASEEDRKFDEILVGNQYVKTHNLLPFANAAQLIIQPLPELPLSGIEEINAYRTRFVQNRYLLFAGWVALVVILIILLGNYFLFSYFYEKNNELATTQQLFLNQSVASKKNQQKLDSVYTFYKELEWDYPSRHSYYADRIAALVPGSVVLTSLVSDPLESRDDESLLFQKHTLIITGTCEDPSDLNNFITSIKNLQEIKNIVLKNYVYKKELNKSNFTIQITTV